MNAMTKTRNRIQKKHNYATIVAPSNNCLQRTPNRANARSGAAEAERSA